MASNTPDQITAAAQNHVNETDYGAEGTVTKCNFYARDVVEAILQQTRPDLRVNSSGGVARANDQFDNLLSSPDWVKQNFPLDAAGVFKKAHAAASGGTLVLVAYKNASAAESGHIAIIVPASTMEDSTTWGMKMPFVAQAGKKNPRQLASEAAKSVFSSLKLSFGFPPGIRDQKEIFFFNG